LSEIDVSAATEAMNNAGGVEHLMSAESAATRGDVVPTPTTATTPASDVQTAQQQDIQQAQPQVVPGLQRDPVTGRWVRADQVAPTQNQSQAPESTESFTPLDPNQLAPELQAFYKSMQADYTRKTQELATQRAQIEQLGPLDQLQAAHSIYTQLQDPQTWPQLHAELTEGMKAMGLTQAEAEAAASTAIASQTPQSDPLAQLDDPELAPIKTAYEQLQGQLAALQNQFQEQQARQQQEQLEMAVLGEFTRQENIIRQSHPDYTDEDIKAIYELSSYHNGNLLQAQQRYDQVLNDHLARYLNSKQGVANDVASLPGVSALTGQPAAKPRTLDEGHAMAMEVLKQLEASD
jgi:hypothetical protein